MAMFNAETVLIDSSGGHPGLTTAQHAGPPKLKKRRAPLDADDTFRARAFLRPMHEWPTRFLLCER